MASSAVESMAEEGVTSGLRTVVDAAIAADPQTALSVLSRSGNVGVKARPVFEDVELTSEFRR